MPSEVGHRLIFLSLFTHLGLVHADEPLVDFGPGRYSTDVPQLVGVLSKRAGLHLKGRGRELRKCSQRGSLCISPDSVTLTSSKNFHQALLPVPQPSPGAVLFSHPRLPPLTPTSHREGALQPLAPLRYWPFPASHFLLSFPPLLFLKIILKENKNPNPIPQRAGLRSAPILPKARALPMNTAGLSKKMTHSPFRTTTSSSNCHHCQP